MTRRVVLFTCLAIFACIIGWDAYLYMDGVPGNSITQTVIALTKYPLFSGSLGFFFGALFFHFFDTTSQK